MTQRLFDTMLAAFAVIIVIGLLFGTLFIGPNAWSQEGHHLGHAHYQNWVNGLDKGCCNDHDCGSIKDELVRDTAQGTFVHIDGKWCQVQPHHYLKRGNAPNWSTAHVCVRLNYSSSDSDPCERLLCYQPKPLI
jgi:hypothetical protein